MRTVTNRKEPAAFGITPKTARAVADPWRLRILTEVGAQPLSPSRFVEAFGGELTHISRCFRQLAKWNYIEIVEERPGRRRGAAVEHLYRAIRAPHFDTSTWGGVPRNERDAASRSVLSAYQQRVRAAVLGGTFDQEPARHLSWDAAVLDKRAWGELGKRLDSILDLLVEHELQSAQRLAESPAEHFPAVVGLASFRSPGSPASMLRGEYRQGGPAQGDRPDVIESVGPELAKALSNRWRCQILSEVGIHPMSPSQFVETVGGSMTHISRCFRELSQWGFLEILEERSGGRRGGIERVYTSTRRPYFDTPTWETLPQVVRAEISKFILDTYFGRVNKAIEAGTFDSDIDRHLSWKKVVVDRSSWIQIGDCLDDVLASIPELEKESLQRADYIEDLIPTTIHLAAFRSPSAISE